MNLRPKIPGIQSTETSRPIVKPAGRGDIHSPMTPFSDSMPHSSTSRRPRHRCTWGRSSLRRAARPAHEVLRTRAASPREPAASDVRLSPPACDPAVRAGVLCAGGAFSIAQLTANTDISRHGVTKHLQVLADPKRSRRATSNAPIAAESLRRSSCRYGPGLRFRKVDHLMRFRDHFRETTRCYLEKQLISRQHRRE